MVHPLAETYSWQVGLGQRIRGGLVIEFRERGGGLAVELRGRGGGLEGAVV